MLMGPVVILAASEVNYLKKSNNPHLDPASF
jgi:hypothetical protein